VQHFDWDVAFAVQRIVEGAIRQSRKPEPAPWHVAVWDGITSGEWVNELEQSDVCVNLAGRNVNCRYTARNRRAIYDSRIQSARLLNDVVLSRKNPPRLWINASTATIYRHALDRPMNESDGELGGTSRARQRAGTSRLRSRGEGKTPFSR